jgi:nucleotide-binding universal stress UspA family protein
MLLVQKPRGTASAAHLPVAMKAWVPSPIPGSTTSRQDVFLDILFGVDGTTASYHALQRAIGVARGCNSRPTLISFTSPPRGIFAFAGVSVGRIAIELGRNRQRVLSQAVEAVAEGVIVHTILQSSQPGPEICKEWRAIPTTWSSSVHGTEADPRNRRPRSVNPHIRYLAKVPILPTSSDGTL